MQVAVRTIVTSNAQRSRMFIDLTPYSTLGFLPMYPLLAKAVTLSYNSPVNQSTLYNQTGVTGIMSSTPGLKSSLQR